MTKVLILTPVKDAVSHLERYFENLSRLTYPAELISLGLLEGDSVDGTADALRPYVQAVGQRLRRADLWRRDFGFRMPPGLPRWTHGFQLPRRKVLARARNHLLFRALDDEDWVLWLDVDLASYPADLIEQLLATDREIVHPHCVVSPGGRTFDLNAWRAGIAMDQMRGGEDLVRLDAVGGTALWVKADVHRDGLIFPPFPYGAANLAVRRPHPLGLAGELETEGLGLMAQDMGKQCWGMPNLEIVHE